MRSTHLLDACLLSLLLAPLAAAQSPLLVNADAAGAGGNADGQDAMVSATGRYVAFVSWATNLVPEGGDGVGNVFVRDMITQGVPSDVPIFLQFWIQDAGGIKGFAASNGLQGTTP